MWIASVPTRSTDPYSDNVIGLCPTGALLSRDFLYQSRVWYLEPVRSVCTGCSRGCSVNLWRRKKEWQLHALGDERNRMIYRVTACENPQINGPWICNKGFDLHKLMARERALPMLGGTPATLDQALDRARELWAQAKQPAVLVSAHASNEELDAFAAALEKDSATRLRSMRARTASPRPVRSSKTTCSSRPTRTRTPTGCGSDSALRPSQQPRRSGHDLFLIWGECGELREPRQRSPDPPERLRTASASSDADVVIPISTTFERSGSFLQLRGQAQPVRKGVRQAGASGARRRPCSRELAAHDARSRSIYGSFMLFAIAFMMGLATVFTWVERKQSAITSDRIGANRCYVRFRSRSIKLVAWGLFHGIADGGKLLLKENFTPLTYDRVCYNLAPWLAAVPVLLLFAVVPFGGVFAPAKLVDAATFPNLARHLADFFGERSYVMRVAGLDAGILVRACRLRDRRTRDDARRLVVEQQVLAHGRRKGGVADDLV